MPSTTRLSLYNQALRLCGERRLASLTEGREPRRLLDDVWNGGIVDECLEAGQWNFAMRTVQIDHDPDVDPAFGLLFAFSKPDDWIRTCAFSSDERFNSPYRDYKDEVAAWYADLDPIYVRYVSNDAAYGADLSLWPQSFAKFVAAALSADIVFKLTGDKERIALVERMLTKRKRDALNKDAMNEATQMPVRGSWVRSRFGRGTPGNNDGGSRGNLIG